MPRGFGQNGATVKGKLCFGWRGVRSILVISSSRSESSLDLCFRFDVSKSKNHPEYSKDFPILIVGVKWLLINSFGRYWTDFVKAFLIPNVLHYSTPINMLDHWHQMVNRFRRCWFPDSWPVITAASLTNWNQWIGFINCREKPNWRYFSYLICWM